MPTPTPTPAGGSGNSTSGGSGPGGGGPPSGRRLQGPAKSQVPSDVMMGSDGKLPDAALELLSMPYCKITLKDDTEFPCTLQEKYVGPGGGAQKLCLKVDSPYIGMCTKAAREAGEKVEDVKTEACDGDYSLTWDKVEVRFKFEVKMAPPIYAQEFKAFLFEQPEDIKSMDQGNAMTFGMPFDQYTTLVAQRVVHNVLRVGARADEPDQRVFYTGVQSSSPIGNFPQFQRPDQNYSIAIEIKKNPAVTQQVITDEDPLNLYILAGTLLGAFGYVGLAFSLFFPESLEDRSSRQFMNPLRLPFLGPEQVTVFLDHHPPAAESTSESRGTDDATTNPMGPDAGDE